MTRASLTPAAVAGFLLLFGVAAAAHAQNTVVPGRSAGRVRLGATYQTVAHVLGGDAPTGDAAMGGKLWATWFAGAKPNQTEQLLPPFSVRQTNVYFTRDLIDGSPSGTQRVRAVQVNSPYFHTVPGSITPGKSTLADIRRAFPRAARSGDSYSLGGKQRGDYYADAKRGIGFLVTHTAVPSRGVCRLLIVFRPGTAAPPYLNTP